MHDGKCSRRRPGVEAAHTEFSLCFRFKDTSRTTGQKLKSGMIRVEPAFDGVDHDVVATQHLIDNVSFAEPKQLSLMGECDFTKAGTTLLGQFDDFGGAVEEGGALVDKVDGTGLPEL